MAEQKKGLQKPLFTESLSDAGRKTFINVNAMKSGSMTLSITQVIPPKEKDGKPTYKRIVVTNPKVGIFAALVKKGADFVVKNRKKK